MCINLMDVWEGIVFPLESKKIIHFVYGKGICSLHRLLKAAKGAGSKHPREGEGTGVCQLHGPAHTHPPVSLSVTLCGVGRSPQLCVAARPCVSHCRVSGALGRERLELHTLLVSTFLSSAVPALLQPSLFIYFCQLTDGLHSAFPRGRGGGGEHTQHTGKKGKIPLHSVQLPEFWS